MTYSNPVPYQRRRLMAEINVVPYIDVMLVLLIIFMITAPLLTQGVEVDLPQAAAEALTPEQRKPLVLTVDAAGKYYLNIGEKPDQAIAAANLTRLARAVLSNEPDIPVLVKGDRRVAYGEIMTAMVILQQAGAPKVGLITEPPDADQ